MPDDLNPPPQGLLRKLTDMAARFDEIQRLLSDETVLSDHVKVGALSRESGQLVSVVSRFRSYQAAIKNVNELRALHDDPDMGEIARAELPDAIGKANALAEAIKSDFVAAEDNRVDSFFLEIRAGTGGEEAALFARDLFEMYRRYCDSHGWSFVPSDYSVSERGGFKEVIVNIKGDGAYRHLQYESGGHRVQRVPETEAQGRIHTSAATVAVLPELADVKIDINPKDIEEFGCRGGGPGGQNVNKVETGWFISHKPSGLQFKMTEHKSQAQNKERAWALLRATLYERERAKQHAQVTGARKAMMGSGDRSERIRTYNFPQNRCTDHRLGGEESSAKNFNLEAVIAGQMEELIDALIELDTRARLEAL
ncbi:MAG: PCRF domain-containing protein [Tepidisphaeraceae bacterium]